MATALAFLGTLATSPAQASTPIQHVVGHAAAHSPQPHNLTPPAVPVSGSYLGADPDADAGEETSVQANALEHATERVLGLVSFYIKWTQAAPISQMTTVAASGSIPFISMKCGPSDASVAAGQYDSALRADAKQLAQYGGPVLFRWFWEMNLPKVSNHPNCLGDGDVQGQSNEYIAAYRHIWNIFRSEGATNVGFVWCPSDADAAQNNENVNLFYPGAAYVNWIGADLYDRPLAHPLTFPQQFGAFYDYWSNPLHGDHKPILIGETGATTTPTGSASTNQVTWLGQISKSLQTTFHDVHAVVYVDAVDQGNYILTPGPHGGLAAFGAMARNGYFEDFGPRNGYILASAGGQVYTYATPNLGSATHLTAPIVGIAYDNAASGYWLVGSDGRVYAFGKAHYYGSMGGKHLNKPIVGMAATPNGEGYWLVATDGGIFAFGNAKFYGSMGAHHLNKPIVGMTSAPGGKGYWFVAADGGIFSFGTAKFHGSTGAMHLNQPVNGMCATLNGDGYWLVAADGGIFAFGNAQFLGSLGASKQKVHITAMSTDSLTGGYRMVTLKGAVYQFPGTVELSTGHFPTPVVGIATTASY